MLGALRVHVVLEAVSVPFFAQFLDEEDEFVPDAELVAGGRAVLDELARVTTALGTLRAA
ncbi:hypothetical protein [Geodermatophilus normandii]|uniref:hypothetical protein n=1 Tax=Geodermatophilus normandii TaxID=1137989 RepID=UPI001953DFE1|nr:hypothetical protein [Geodermatophilus normandii]